MLAVIELFGGVGLFLFGMSLMGKSLEKLAGSKLEKILETLTTSKKKGVGAIKGWALGMGVTGVIQSSAATTIMIIGFVNAGIMKVSQSIPVIFGANVGSTVTAQILRLGDLGSGNIVLTLLKPSSFAPMLIASGVAVMIFSKKQKYKDIAGIMVGLGVLFYGMTIMEGVFAPLKESKEFQKLFTSFENPIIGILTGVALTAVIQSSSAFVGILQALSATGTISYGIAIPLILGQNIGKCSAILMGSIGSNKKAKRAAFVYIFFNIILVTMFGIIIYSVNAINEIESMKKIVNRGDIANVHLLFNLITSIVLLPFSNAISRLSAVILKDNDEDVKDEDFKRLDDMLLKTPAIALNQSKLIMKNAGDRIRNNMVIISSLLEKYDENQFKDLDDNEAYIDKCETYLSGYVIHINRKRLPVESKLLVTEILKSVGDYERIGDYCMNIAYALSNMNQEKIDLSNNAKKELKILLSNLREILDNTFISFDNDDIATARKIRAMVAALSRFNELLKNHHVERLQEGQCSVKAQTVFYDIINSCERIAYHSRTISIRVLSRNSQNEDVDDNDMISDVNYIYSDEYTALEKYYYFTYTKSLKKSLKNQEEKALKTNKTQKDKNLRDNKKNKDKAKNKKKSEKDSNNRKSFKKENNKDNENDKDNKKKKKKT